MAKLFRNCVMVILILILLLLIFILTLEIGIRNYPPPAEPPKERVFIACDSNLYPPDPAKLTLLEKLVEKRRQNIIPSKEELENAMYLVPNRDMIGINGVYCNEMIFVSERLPTVARYYVARHELEHLFQAAGVAGDYQDHELSANWVAASEYPLGLFQTVVSSLVGSYQLSPSFWVFLLNGWHLFKFYFLGLS